MRYFYVEFVCKSLCKYRIYIIRNRYSTSSTPPPRPRIVLMRTAKFVPWSFESRIVIFRIHPDVSDPENQIFHVRRALKFRMSNGERNTGHGRTQVAAAVLTGAFVGSWALGRAGELPMETPCPLRKKFCSASTLTVLILTMRPDQSFPDLIAMPFAPQQASSEGGGGAHACACHAVD